jgi:hypothetical protein
LDRIAAPSAAYLYWGLEVNDSGEISALGLVSGATHVFVLVPCNEGNRGCEELGARSPIGGPVARVHQPAGAGQRIIPTELSR